MGALLALPSLRRASTDLPRSVQRPARHVRARLAEWSPMFPQYRLLRAACPALAGASCCLAVRALHRAKV